MGPFLAHLLAEDLDVCDELFNIFSGKVQMHCIVAVFNKVINKRELL